MPPRVSFRPLSGRFSLRKGHTASRTQSKCLFCSFGPTSSPSTSRPSRIRKPAHDALRFQSTAAEPPKHPHSTNVREELVDALLDLQKIAPSYLNLSRLQLALQGLRQRPGEESIRVAILGLTNGAESGSTAKDLLHVLLADSLSPESGWERELADHDPQQPLVVRIRQSRQQDEASGTTLTISKTNLLHELEVSCPGLNDLNLELLLTEISPLTGGAASPTAANAVADVEETVLVPTVDIPSNTGRFNSITTPVHKALIVTRGIMGAASVATLPVLEDQETVLAAVDLPGYSAKKDADTTFQPVDVSAAIRGISLFRESLNNAVDSQRLVNQSNIPALISWLKAGARTDDGASTKPAVRQLVASLLQNASAAIQDEEARRLGGVLSSETVNSASPALNRALAEWSQEAHEELQLQLDLAFAGRRWRKLGWWKLFWRADDVSYLTNEILTQRFLPGAERDLIYLAGQIEGSTNATSTSDKPPPSPRYTQPIRESEVAKPDESGTTAAEEATPKSLSRNSNGHEVTNSSTTTFKWPTHISFTRRYLHAETVPALQALAQRLVLQASSTSALAASLSGLLYLSSPATTLYEAGAVTALGVMWSLRRMQKKWETAREFWEGDVREEGRKAVRGAEASVAGVLDGKGPREGEGDAGAGDESRMVKDAVDRAADALARMK